MTTLPQRKPHPALAMGDNRPLLSIITPFDIGLDWTADLSPCYVLDADANMRPIPHKKALVRSDNGLPLGVVGERFEPYQNHQAIEFLRQIGDNEARIAGVQQYRGGEHVTIACAIPSMSVTFGKDETDGFLLLSNRHGSGSMTIDLLVLRKICQNGMRRWIKSEKNSIRHTAGIHGKANDLSNKLGKAFGTWRHTIRELEQMTQVAASSAILTQITHAAFEVTVDTMKSETERSKTIRENREANIRHIRRSPTCNVDGTAKTIYSDLQAVIEYIQHERNDNDGESSLFGSGAEMIERAHAKALELATV